MVQSKITEFEHDLNEILCMFDGGAELSVRHLLDVTEDKFVNTIVVKGKCYAFGTLKPKMEGEVEEKRIYKRYAKLALYRALSMFLGQELPWGALSGIRPTKLAYSSLKTDGEFENFFKYTMKVSDSKTELVKDVIEAQKGIYQKKDGNVDFFVFIPFCPSRCKYCSFISADIKTAKEYVCSYCDSLIREIKSSKNLIKNLRSIYIGGGTPASLSDKDFDRVLCAVDEINTGVEYTVEAGRPDVITQEKVDIMLKHGVTRVCVNPQTFNQKTLVKIKREHTVADFYRAYELVKDKFIINVDLIAGLEDESVDDFKFSLDSTLKLRPDNITVHTLSIKRGSELCEKEDRLNIKDISKMVDYARAKLTQEGYRPYYVYRQKYMAGNLENVGYALKGKECVYNVDVMEETTDNLACGAGAISKKVDFINETIERIPEPKDVKTYIEKVDSIIEEKEKLFK